MIKIKNLLSLLLTIIIIGVIFLNRELIYSRIEDVFNSHPEIVIKEGNQYAKNDNFSFVRQVTDYEPHNYEDLKNIFYSILNQGFLEFTFYCPKDYKNCLSDVATLSYDEVLLSDINNYVHPYNSYSTIKTLYDDTGEVTVKVNHLYSTSEILRIEKDIDNMIDSNINDTMTDKEKIKVIHDYIINNTKYDTEKADTDNSPYDSARIQGVLYDHYSICSGYTDTMAVVLNKLNIPNFKIASESHIWNAVYIDDEWQHLDLTWDDPVTKNGSDILDHSYFLINSDTLKSLDVDIQDHQFDKNRYSEVA